MEPTVWPGRPFPQGAHFDGAGVNFALYSQHATRVEVCLFHPSDPSKELFRQALPEQTEHIFHGYFPGLSPGALYGFRVHGPWDPLAGQRFNPAKLLMDPYARAVYGKVDHRGPLRADAGVGAEAELTRSELDSAAFVPRSVVVEGRFDWEGDAPLRIPWDQTLIYELHLKGFTQLHPEIPPELRGTYAGLAHPAAVAHLQRLGVTAVELLPIHEAVDEPFLAARGLSNYWGYSTLSFFAPSQRYSSQGGRGGQLSDFKAMVKALHRAGIEVILDVVYNHSCEGGEAGPTLCYRGVDNRTYYRLLPHAPRFPLDLTGTGNTFHLGHPQVVRMVMDSLRYWVEECHVDGFRFDLAAVLGRGTEVGFRPDAPFFQALQQEPLLRDTKLLAEPWDLGEFGYQQGNFPVDLSEWNGRFRDTVRRFWKGEPGQAAELGSRLTGSSDLFQASGRKPTASINFITTHDGFTLADLVRFNQKHNEANGEENRDGSNENDSWNFGVEGETEDPAINLQRARQVQNLLSTLLLSQGVPLLLAGDEVGRSQRGNNNAYCQDNELSWLNWNWSEAQRARLDFCAGLIRLRREQPVLRRRQFLTGQSPQPGAPKDLTWYLPDGREMEPSDWHDPELRSLAFLLEGGAIGERDGRGGTIRGDSLMVLINGQEEALDFALPGEEPASTWEWLLDTGALEGLGGAGLPPVKARVELSGRSLVVLRRV